MADDTSAFDAQTAPQPGLDSSGVISITGDKHPAGAAYETQAGPVLDAFDQRLAAQKAALAAAQKTQALTQAAATTAAQRHVTAVNALKQSAAPQQSALASQDDDSAPQGAFTPPPMSLADYLKQHGDDEFEAANQDAKRVHGKSADEMYDELQKNQYIQPAEQELTKRQKAEALMHVGLEMLKNSTSKNRWTQNPVGAFGAAGEAGLNDVENDQKENMQQAANRAHEEYLQSQNIGLKRAGEEAAAEKEDQQQAGENARNQATTKRDLLIHQYDQEQQNAREKAELAERHADRGATKAAQQKTMVDDQGFQREQRGGKWVLSKDENGQPIKAAKSAEDTAKAEAVRAQEADRATQRREAHEKDWGAEYDKAHPQIAGLSDPAADAARQHAHDQEMAEFDRRQASTGGAATQTAPQGALDALRAHPEKAAEFKAKYGYLPQ